MRPLRVAEVFGLSPWKTRVREAATALRGDAHTPPSRFDLSSLRIFRPRMALPLWAGRAAHGRLIPIYNLYSYAQPPPERGWSVRVTDARDFLGSQLTYDSHNGTDFAVPIGTTVVAAAPGVVRRVSSEFNRGGLKVFIDHGEGLVTTSNHLARSLVRVGDRVRRAQPVALSGYSGIDGFTTFPFGAPHVHFNVWLDGEYVDPFAITGETALWRDGNWPTPCADPDADDRVATPSKWDRDAIARTLASCLHDETRRDIASVVDEDDRALAVVFHRNYFPTRFGERPPLTLTRTARRGRLDLPFRREDFDGIWFPHGVEPRRG